MQWCRAHMLFIISLTPYEPLFLCSVLNSLPSSIFLLPPEPPLGQELPLPGSWNILLCLLFLFSFFQIYYEILVLWDSEKTWKNLFVAYPSLWDVELLSSVPCQLQPTFFNIGSSVHGV